jgi:predicted nucleic acid-binding protein
LIDSWAWIEYFKGTPAGKRAKPLIEGTEEIMVSTINLAEVYRWILHHYNESLAEEKLKAIKARTIIQDVTEEIAVEAAKLREAKKWGLGDALIYATVKVRNAKILTGDPDFKGTERAIFIGF